MTSRIVALAWTFAVVVVLWMPPSDRVLFPHADKLIHLGAFAGVAWLWRRSGSGALAVALGGAALGLITELGQSYLPWPRSADAFDFAADVAGLLLGLAVAKQQRRPEAASRRNGRDSNPR